MADIHGHILVVDDNRMNRITLSSSLKLQGHTVALAEDGEEALTMTRATPYDAVLLDIIMPGKDGYTVLQEMKQDAELREIPVIVISALDEIESAVRCIELGAEDYLPKPFDPVLLKARLRATLEKKKLRDLERAYLQQEVMLRQNEKLATLGKLSAGMAHELNNPVAAVLRGTEHIATALADQTRAHLALDRGGLTPAQVDALDALNAQAETAARLTGALDALTRADREAELEDWLDAAGLEDAWEVAPGLVNMGLAPHDLERLAAQFDAAQLAHVLDWAVNRYTVHSVLREISEGSGRVAEIVKALKTFTYLDQAPVQNVDIHAGLDNTLVILRNKLKQGVNVHRDYAADLPLIEARGSELNQVWTNIIDNAIQAMDGHGDLYLRTLWQEPWVVVEIEDNGPGIPAEIQPRLFDPFFTTKPPGEGTGLGLNISHNIIVQKHGGTIGVESEPGKTVFRVKLPLHAPKQVEEA
ncbi:MAG: response regulator [Caldilineaceae bacterium]|nr:response regulator [Caldilineaceae bacterium]